ncbi:GvpL/GvpF family gas vesicle protein [Streptomyces sp. P17]|uniref:GvpL/GvpF family gas vesicle protein n=1 Tax=Streptomyces sp. P17 TaxID=3074716 RepID=UPI0028F411E5|nr:GvpL/GvpF family gas vesicle protein [Streptomyces sp. P17]MDT9701595.1 GvpL/GvpF family gas vesicle protein [Streptomyces sp. P17]
MSVYVYAIAKESHPLDLKGLEGVGGSAEPHPVRGGSLCAVVSEAPEDVSVSRDDLQAHFGVVEGLWNKGPILPMGFGFVAPDEDSVSALLEQRAEEFTQRLDEFTGRSEFNVKGVQDEAAVLRAVLQDNAQARRLNELTRSGEGTYEDRLALGELVAQEVQRRQGAMAEEVLAAVRPVASAEQVAPSSQQYFVSASFLVDDDRSEEFTRAVRELAERYGEGVELRVRGPLPPYSFV